MWFRNKNDEGVLYPEFYRPFPEVRLALLLTAVSYIIVKDLYKLLINKLLRLNAALTNGALVSKP
jgi:hypothetical protein